MFFFKLGLKNLSRHRNRTLITAAIIAIAVFYYIVFDSLLIGMNQMAYENVIDFEAGHLQITSQDYWQDREELPLKGLITPDSDLQDSIEDLPGFQGLSTELHFRTKLNNGINELPVIAKGIKPGQAGNVFKWEEHFVDGSLFKEGEKKVVMGKHLADLMKLKTGDYVTLLFRTKEDTFNTIEAEISGLLKTANTNVNQNILYLPLDVVQNSLNVDNQISHLVVRLEDQNKTRGAVEELKDKINTDLKVTPWYDLEAISIIGAKQSANQLILLIILTIAAIGIINSVILAALERMEEIGMMKALGFREREIVYTFILESTGISVLGGVAGCIMGAIGVKLLATFGIDWSSLIDMDLGSFGIPILGKLYGGWNPGAFITVFIFANVVSILASIFPAYWAASKDPVDAIYRR